MASKKKVKPQARARDHGFDYVDHALRFQSQEKIKGLSDSETRAYASAVMQRESGGVVNQDNHQGYFGQYQFGAEALVETGLIDREKFNQKIAELKKQYGAKKWRAAWYKKNNSLQEEFLRDKSNWKTEGGLESFLADKALQDKKFVEYTNKQIQQGIHFKAISEKDSAETLAAYAGAAHLKGAGGANALFKNNNAVRDGNGTSTVEYAVLARKAIKELAPKVADGSKHLNASQSKIHQKKQEGNGNGKTKTFLKLMEDEAQKQIEMLMSLTKSEDTGKKENELNIVNSQGAKIIQAAKSYFVPGRFEYGRPDGKNKNKSPNGKTDASRLEKDGDGDGLKGVDCSALVWRALVESGISLDGLPSQAGFTTRSLFNGDNVTNLAKKNFTPIPKNKALEPGAMQPGDLMMFSGRGGQHVAIFEGYDKDGKAKFFGSQTSTGPATTYLQKDQWNEKFKGVLRLKSVADNQVNNIEKIEKAVKRDSENIKKQERGGLQGNKQADVSREGAVKKNMPVKGSVGKPAGVTTPKFKEAETPKKQGAVTGKKNVTKIIPSVSPEPGGGVAIPRVGVSAVAADAIQLQAILSALQATLSQLSSVLSQPIQVTVDVQNGNIVAAVNAANSQQQRRS